MKMANKTADARAKCPYYLSESLLRIRCEGAVSDEVVSVFRTFADKCAFFEKYCSTFRFEHCPMYSMITEAGEGTGES